MTKFDICKEIGALWNKRYAGERFEKWVARFIREKLGYEVLTSGWPDYLIVTSEGKIRAVEIKQGADTVKPNQRRMHELLRKAGIPTIVLRDKASLARFLDENPQFKNDHA